MKKHPGVEGFYSRKKRRVGRPLDIKWLIHIPLIATAAIAGLALSSTLHAKNWDFYSWQGMVLSLALMIVLVWFVMAPLLIIEQKLKEEK